MEKPPKNSNEQKESPAPRPKLLNVVMINGRLAQIYSEEGENVAFLDEKPASGRVNKLYEINWDEYDYKRERDAFTVRDLRKSGVISEKEYMAIHWGPEEKTDPYVRDLVKFFGRFEKKG